MPENDWTREEVEAAVADYLDMLNKELRGEPFNKAEHNRLLRMIITERSRSSIERKHQNISAVMLQLGFPYVEGYKPYSNYQKLVREVVAERLQAAQSLTRLVETTVEKRIKLLPPVPDILAMQVAPPVPDKAKVARSSTQSGPYIKRNYLDLEARNQSLGLAGEELVLKFERERLWTSGHKALAERIEHVSVTRGDYAGFDILSFDKGGRERFIEVKTTNFGPLTPFFASRNEVRKSEEFDSQYRVYRVFNFKKQPHFFILSGALKRTCNLTPTQYSATPS
ncbi:MAG: DUF3883 domain-containing protein [Chthoniobacteraceae bacterium]